MAWVDYIIVAAAGYLLGAIPFAVIIARACGVDIFKVGSGNPGATNVKRSCGKFAGNLCFILDASKGFVATAFPLYAHLFSVDFSDPQMLAYVGLVAAIVGHSFSVFIKFRGGKGVAVAIGGLLAIMWLAILISLILWVVVFYSTRYVSLASIAMALALPVAAALLYKFPGAHAYIAIAIAVVIIFRHRSNIVRLIKGTENRF
jgi:acyl-phosphate glycerol 3-phosphate acyltransferase